MATVNIFNEVTKATYSVAVESFGSVIASAGGGGVGSTSWYVSVSTSKKDPAGGSIPARVITSISTDITSEVEDAIAELMSEVAGGFLSSSSSSESSVNSSSSQSSSSSQTNSSSSSSSSPSSSSKSSRTESSQSDESSSSPSSSSQP